MSVWTQLLFVAAATPTSLTRKEYGDFMALTLCPTHSLYTVIYIYVFSESTHIHICVPREEYSFSSLFLL